MTQAKFTKPVNRLASRVGSKGLSRPAAVAQAGANLDSIRDDILAYVDRHLAEMEAIAAGCEDGADPALAGLYDPSNAVAGTAGTAGLAPLGKAAYSLCHLVANGDQHGVYSLPAIKLHLDAMRLLRRFSSPDQDREAAVILENLAKLVASVMA
jgi:hypothetical protein